LRFGTEEQRSQLIDTLTARWQSFIPADSRCPIRAVKVGLVRIDGELKFANDFKKDQITDTATILVDGSFYPLASNPSALLACAMGLHEISLQLAERGSKPSFDEVPHLTLTRFAESLGFALKGRDGNLGSILAWGGAIKPTGEGLELEPDFSDTTPFLGIDRKRFPGYALVELA
jgi:hypothetical protein